MACLSRKQVIHQGLSWDVGGSSTYSSDEEAVALDDEVLGQDMQVSSSSEGTEAGRQ